ncbi:uncharacterized protein PHALS_15019 [Plasmopara halstedii]|uniref:Uncharacterized protein n=1 Tax=Plasmopara halstedii TaxID=4781 RepID=A0A0P1A9S1_PLAHL|nr:uncharacterized protein PHALS_15019 [Plasmopara halstedii]CEG37082.1 hypothetical protein PHALS_15019 [Plasmopara halstedii]|eukprot:XP_024573451.1 hypothetical protein PHALS_15019 [Plasmopara halstedii]
MPQAMEIDGSGEVDHSKPVAPFKKRLWFNDIETLSKQLQKISVSDLAKEHKKMKKSRKSRYIDTSKLLNFKCESKRSSSKGSTIDSAYLTNLV